MSYWIGLKGLSNQFEFSGGGGGCCPLLPRHAGKRLKKILETLATALKEYWMENYFAKSIGDFIGNAQGDTNTIFCLRFFL
jgi:hypothetical protein